MASISIDAFTAPNVSPKTTTVKLSAQEIKQGCQKLPSEQEMVGLGLNASPGPFMHNHTTPSRTRQQTNKQRKTELAVTKTLLRAKIQNNA